MKATYPWHMEEAPENEEANPSRPSYSVGKADDLSLQAFLGNLAGGQHCNVTPCFDNCRRSVVHFCQG